MPIDMPRLDSKSLEDFDLWISETNKKKTQKSNKGFSRKS